jgi:hypothetical protein
MKREILINATPRETRIAILEDEKLVELLLDRPEQRRMVGDIYLGKVDAVLPGIQAAFVDLGTDKSAFRTPPTSPSATSSRRTRMRPKPARATAMANLGTGLTEPGGGELLPFKSY